LPDHLKSPDRRLLPQRPPGRPGRRNAVPQGFAAHQADPLLLIAAQFHSSARAEIVQRIASRDTALFLFLAGSATIFGVSFHPAFRPALYAIPILGLGAAQVYSQHSTVIGAIGRYLGTELHSWLYRNYADCEIPPQWDSSTSLLEMRGPGYLRPVMLSGLALIFFPELISLVVAGATNPMSAFDISGLAIGSLAVILTGFLVVSTHRVRVEYAKEIKSHVADSRDASGAL
jgi:hypothetical protein